MRQLIICQFARFPTPRRYAPDRPLDHRALQLPRHDLAVQLGAVLQVVHLLFNEGYSATAGAEITRAELTGETIRLGRLLAELRAEPEVIGLLSLVLLPESR
jgi:predicted RNA polymerase sigma factor